ncbi:hypothetical protein D030_2379B, partial [Vibrio parahaemolyticus AQ3810]
DELRKRHDETQHQRASYESFHWQSQHILPIQELLIYQLSKLSPSYCLPQYAGHVT